jgi:hypothetical protein
MVCDPYLRVRFNATDGETPPPFPIARLMPLAACFGALVGFAMVFLHQYPAPQLVLAQP